MSEQEETDHAFGYSNEEEAELREWCRKQLSEIIKRPRPPKGVPADWRPTVEKTKDGAWLVTSPDMDWRPKIVALIECFQDNNVDSVAKNLTRLLPLDPSLEQANCRQSVEVEKSAVRGLLKYLQAIQGEQAKSAGGGKTKSPQVHAGSGDSQKIGSSESGKGTGQDGKKKRASNGPSVKKTHALFIALISSLPDSEHSAARDQWSADKIRREMAEEFKLSGASLPSAKQIERMLKKEHYRQPKGAKPTSGEFDGTYWDDPDDPRQRQMTP